MPGSLINVVLMTHLKYDENLTVLKICWIPRLRQVSITNSNYTIVTELPPQFLETLFIFSMYIESVFPHVHFQRREKKDHESLLRDEYFDCKTFLNQFLPVDKQMIYLGFDMARYTKK